MCNRSAVIYPAITIWQPWASLIQAGAKPYEWRHWPAPNRLIGRRIAIHAGARKVKKTEIADLLYQLQAEGDAGTSLIVDKALPLLERWLSSPGQLPLSSVLCLATLGKPITAAEYSADRAALDSDRIDHSTWAWPLSDIEALGPFVPAKGAQGFWEWASTDGIDPL